MAEPGTASSKDLVGMLDEYLVRKAPFQIPEGGKEFLVKYGPWISVVMLVISLPVLLLALGIGTMLMPFAGAAYAGGFGIATLFILAQFGLMVIALPGLFDRKKSAWQLMFYAQLVGLVFSLLTGRIIGGLIGALIGLYILFQIRAKYVN
jgi:hypothetical protein